MYNIVTWKEWETYVWKVLENSVSSFWNSEKEAYNNTKEALELFCEWNDESYQEIQISSPKLYSVEMSHA